MDIYQIWSTYNKKWSKYEILAFSVILLLTVIIMAYCLWKKKLNIIQAGAVVAMVIFLGIVFGSTVFTRTSTVRQYELMPLWSWRAIIRYHDWGLLKEDLLNCILLLPAGALLPVITNHKVKWYQNVCPYCNRNFIENLKVAKNKKVKKNVGTFELDHFYSKDEFPIGWYQLKNTVISMG